MTLSTGSPALIEATNAVHSAIGRSVLSRSNDGSVRRVASKASEALATCGLVVLLCENIGQEGTVVAITVYDENQQIANPCR